MIDRSAWDFTPLNDVGKGPLTTDVPAILLLPCEDSFENAVDLAETLVLLYNALKESSGLLQIAIESGRLGLYHAPFHMEAPTSAAGVAPGQVLDMLRDRRLPGQPDPILTDGERLPFRGSTVSRRWLDPDSGEERVSSFRRALPAVLPVVLAPWPDDPRPIDSQSLTPSLPYVLAIPTALGPQAGAEAIAKSLAKLLGLGDEGTSSEQLCSLDFTAKAFPNVWTPAVAAAELCPWTYLFPSVASDDEASVAEKNAEVATPGGLGISGPIWSIVYSAPPGGTWQLDVFVPHEQCRMKQPLGGLPGESDANRVFCRVCREHLRSRLFGVRPALIEERAGLRDAAPTADASTPAGSATPLPMPVLCDYGASKWEDAHVKIDDTFEIQLWSEVSPTLGGVAPSSVEELFVPKPEGGARPTEARRHTLRAVWNDSDGDPEVISSLSLMSFPSARGPTLWLGFEVVRAQPGSETELRWAFKDAVWVGGGADIVRIEPGRLEQYYRDLVSRSQADLAAGVVRPWEAGADDPEPSVSVRVHPAGKPDPVFGLSIEGADHWVSSLRQWTFRLACDVYWWKKDFEDTMEVPTTPSDHSEPLILGVHAVPFGTGTPDSVPGLMTERRLHLEPDGDALVMNVPTEPAHASAVASWSAQEAASRSRAAAMLQGKKIGPGTLLPLHDVIAPVRGEDSSVS